MATKWSKKKVNPDNINSGNEYEKGDRVSVQALNSMVESGLYSQEFAEALTDAPDVSEAGNVGTPTVSFVDNVKNGVIYKKFKFANIKGIQGEKGEQGIQGEKGEKGEQGATGAKIVSTVLQGQDANGGNIYKQTFDNGLTAMFTAPKGAKGDTGSGAIDVDTLIALLLGSNGIEVAKNAAGDKVEAKLAIPETGPITLTNNNAPRPAIDITIPSGGPPASGGIVISSSGSPEQSARLGRSQLRLVSGSSELTVSPSGIISWYNSSEVGHGLISGGPNGNVKTLFGNQQSIYGSGNIDLYVHSIRFETLYTQVNKGQASFSFEVISSNNIAIDSLTDLFTYLKNRKVPVCGTCSPTGDADYVAQYIDIVGSSNSYIYYIKDNATMTISLSNMDSSLTITDTVTTV